MAGEYLRSEQEYIPSADEYSRSRRVGDAALYVVSAEESQEYTRTHMHADVGSIVTVAYEDGEQQRYQLVQEFETAADAAPFAFEPGESSSVECEAVAVRSLLGAALHGARAHVHVRYNSPDGVQCGVVVSVEPSE